VLIDEAPSAEALTDPFCDLHTGSWFLLRTRSRQEKLVAQDLAARDVLHFLPLMNCVRYHGPRQVNVEVPLFPGYVFLRGNAEDAYGVDRAGRLAQILPIADQKRVNEELKNIWLALSYDAELLTYPYLRKGMRVEVRSGPFRGVRGVIEDWGKRARLVLQVEILGRAVSLEVGAALLDVID
jgi:transcription termination/antitermination protein NusG